MKEPLRVALAHDYLNSWGGGERVLNLFKEKLYPQADVVAITYDAEKVKEHVTYPVRTSFIQKLPGGKRFHKWFLVLMPAAVEQLNFTGYDLVLSDSSGFIKGILIPQSCVHVCYIHTSTRYLTLDQQYFRQSVPSFLHWLMPPLLRYLQKKDLAGSKRPQAYIANSQETAQRIKKYYHRDVEVVIFPPVDTRSFYKKESDAVGESYLIAGRLAPYKRFDLAIKACNELEKRLVVIGDGPEVEVLKKIAGPTIEFRGKVSDEELRSAYASCKAMIFPPFEDAGMTPLECMACGRPVYAYGKGGALESIVDQATGIFFQEQSVEAIKNAIEAGEKVAWNSEKIAEHARGFGEDIFLHKVKTVIDQARATRQG
jgi:glycosyltransferase involved in cell wall biosynthesis